MRKLLLILLLIPSVAFGGFYCANTSSDPVVLHPEFSTRATCVSAGHRWLYNPDADTNGYIDTNAGGFNTDPATNSAGARSIIGAEAMLGNPAADNYVLKSSAAGVRSWGLVGWAELTGIPAGFLDGTDDGGDNLGTATGSDIAGKFTGAGTYLKSDGTKGTPTTSGGTWGSITGTLSNQTDLSTALTGKENATSTIIKESELSSLTNSTSTTTAANSAAVKTAYDLAASKQSPATTLTGYGITDAAPSTQGVSNGNSHDHNGNDGGQIDYSSLSGKITYADLVTLERNIDPYTIKFYYGPPLVAGTCADEDTPPSNQANDSRNHLTEAGWPVANLRWICVEQGVVVTFTGQDSFSLTFSDTNSLALRSFLAQESFSLTDSAAGSMSIQGTGGTFVAAESYSLTVGESGTFLLRSFLGQEAYSVTVSDSGTLGTGITIPVNTSDGYMNHGTVGVDTWALARADTTGDTPDTTAETIQA